jgi:hypothetical protein
MVAYKQVITMFIGLVVGIIAIGILSFVPSKSDKAKYTITSENGKTYYANTFRMYGKGVMFDDIYGNTVIVQGDLEIKCKKTE